MSTTDLDALSVNTIRGLCMDAEDVAARFIAYGWNVTTVADANDLEMVARALHSFRAESERPALVLVHSHIGCGSPVEDMPKAHGDPLGVDAGRTPGRVAQAARERVAAARHEQAR
ncbi:MAG TPA: hypothetical protein VHY31_23320 [Streptosporangiaceae bacterium]|nr:hypothetical protein [Streptosporangiaceae bacterium]